MRILAVFALALAATTILAKDNFPYIYKRGTNTYMRASAMSIEQMVRQSKRWGGEFIWLKLGRQQYLIRDTAVLAAVRQAFAETDALQPAMDEAERRMRPYEERMEVVERRMDALSDQLGDDEDLTDATRESLERRLEDAERDMEAIEREMSKVERAMEELEKEMERREEIAERRFEEIVRRAVDQGKAKRLD